MEGLYIKIEAGGAVAGRYKYVRPGFLQTVLDSGSHWQERPLLPNQLRAGWSCGSLEQRTESRVPSGRTKGQRSDRF